ncbi:MAG: hypothetical protein JW806_04310 [Sedimentisphaerales bacterium]|nr:hypothetical protein [Sedimentisphaerales bacterium]
MDTLNKEQRDILLDYYFKCADQQESDIAKDLLDSHQGAMEFYKRLSHSLSPLEHLDHEAHASCPDHLVEQTLEKLYAHHAEISDAATNNSGLEKLLQAESEKPVVSKPNPKVTKRPSFWRSFAEAAAVAAGVFILASLFIPITRQMKTQANKTTCQANLSKVSRGITQYSNEHDNYLPAVPVSSGSPWWKIGSTGQENQSNTRHLWLLVKDDYLQMKDFQCPGRQTDKSLNLYLSPQQIAELSDFPSRDHIAYSFQLIYDSNKAVMSKRKVPLMADVNPLFEGRLTTSPDQSGSEFDPITLNRKLRQANSPSHRGKGQNILFNDGTVEFTSQRVFGADDDIFTVRDLDIYRGTEKPSSETDVFLVP